MVNWILIFPSSWLSGRSKLHADLIQQLIPADGIVPPDIVEKYAKQTAIHMTHTLPGVLWAGLIPFQLYSPLRKNRPTLHRVLGYIFFLSSIAMAIGIVIIVKRQLLFTNFFPDVPPSNEPIPTEVAVTSLGLYFVFTILNAIRYALKRQFDLHQRWIIRHVASGMWIAIQRILLLTVYSVIYPSPVSRATQRQSFGDAAMIATTISLVCGEVVVHLLSSQTAKRKTV